MKSGIACICLLLGVLILGVLIGIIFGGVISRDIQNDLKGKAIENNCAQYNPQSGEFEWKIKR